MNRTMSMSTLLRAALLAGFLPVAIPAGAEPRATAAEMAERVRQVKLIQALHVMGERWESEHASRNPLGPELWRMGEGAPQGGEGGEAAGRGEGDASGGDADEDAIEKAAGLSQRPARWSNESTASRRRDLRSSGRLGALGTLGTASYARNVLVNDPSLDDDFQGDAQAEPGIAAWDRFVVIAWNDGRGQHEGATFPGFIGIAYSTDGGQTFTQGGVPPSNVPGALGPGTWTSDPVLTVNEKTGDFYFCALFDPFSESEVLHGVAVARFNFVGNTPVWNAPRVVRALPGDFSSTDIDKPWIAADSSSNTLYLSYNRYFNSFDDSVLFTRSTDRGSTWSPSITLSSAAASGWVQGSRPAVGPLGEVYVTWKEVGLTNTGLDYLRIRKSTDRGLTFTPEQAAVTFFDNFGTGAPAFNRDQGIALPSIAVDRTNGTRRGRVYLAWNESVNFYDSLPDSLPTRLEVEDNDSASVAQPFTPGETIKGDWNNLNDFDYYRFEATQGTSYIFWSDHVAPRYRMRVLGTDGVTRLAFSGDPDHFPASEGLIVWTCPVSGRYYLRMVTEGFQTGSYRVRTAIDIPGGDSQRARDQRDVFVASSGDGLTWNTPPSLVHPEESPFFDNWLPEVVVAGSSSVYTVWFDWSDSPIAFTGGQSSIYMARSDDGGGSWSALGPVSDQIGDWTAAHWNVVPNQGDYIGLVATPTTILPVWADPRGSTPDIWTAPFALNALQIYVENVIVDTSGVALTWRARGTPPSGANIYRQIVGSTGYALRAGGTFDGSGRIEFLDDEVQQGTQYRYALGVSLGGPEQIVGERTVYLPGVSSPLFSFMGVRPNPSRGQLVVNLALPDSRPAEIALYDLSGRILNKRTIQGFGPHDVDMGAGLYLESGVYFVHLSHGDREVTRRVSIVR